MKKLVTIVSFVLVTSTVFANETIYHCSQEVEAAKAMILENGSVENEQMFLMATAVALDSCIDVAKQRNFKRLSYSMASMQKRCDHAANQQSDLYHGTCYLKIADLGRFILGQ